MAELEARPPDARALLASAGLAAKKSWGQNFLLDQKLLADIAAASGAGPQQPVVELGAGLGALTYHLLKRGGVVVAVERDRTLAPLLRKALAWAERLEVAEADAATLDYAALAARLGSPPGVAGNLPYHLSSRILVTLADAAVHLRGAVLLVQREVAERVAAAPGNRTYGLLSVLVRRAFTAEVLRIVPAGAFHPRPKVTSAVLRLVPHGRAQVGERDRALVATARAAFSARRKILRNSLAAGLHVEPERVEAALSAAGIAPTERAERLSLDEFDKLAQALVAEGVVWQAGAEA